MNYIDIKTNNLIRRILLVMNVMYDFNDKIPIMRIMVQRKIFRYTN